MIDTLRSVASLYNLRHLKFNTLLPTAPRTLNIPKNRISVEMLKGNFKAKIGVIKEFFTLIG